MAAIDMNTSSKGNERRQLVHLAPGDGETVKSPTCPALTFKLRGAQSCGALAAWENVVAPCEGPPLRVHENEDEIWYALEGSFRFILDEHVSDTKAGAFVYIPRGVVHTWQNIGPTPGRFLVVMAPAGFETFFDQFAELQSDAPPIEAFSRLGPGVGMTVVGPPLSESHPL
jgi:mannose-6-phosphate isomerase-like protein (cupin superfamily)